MSGLIVWNMYERRATRTNAFPGRPPLGLILCANSLTRIRRPKPASTSFLFHSSVSHDDRFNFSLVFERGLLLLAQTYIRVFYQALLFRQLWYIEVSNIIRSILYVPGKNIIKKLIFCSNKQ